MSSINGLGGTSSWAQLSSQRAERPPGGADPAKFKEALFGQLDADASGGVDSAELNSLLTEMSQRSGTAGKAASSAASGTASSTASSTDSAAIFSQMDGDGDGSLTADELDSGLKALLGSPSDTVAFAQSRGMAGAGGPHGAGGPPPGPPPGEASEESSEASSAAIDPLDTNADGTVSAAEQAAGDVQEALKSLMQAVDSDGDEAISRSEARQFVDVLRQLRGDEAQTGHNAIGSTGTGSSTDSASAAADFSRMADQVMRHYAQAAASASESALTSALSETA